MALFRKLRKLIRQKNKEVFERFKEKGIPSNIIDLKYIVLPLTEAIEEYSEIIFENTQEAVRRGMIRTLINYPVKKAKPKKPTPKELKALMEMWNVFEYSIAISEMLKQYTFEASERTMARLIGNIMENLQESYEQGYGYDKAAQYLKEVFTNMETYELERVARTEIASMENLGSFEMDKELGVEYHMWETAHDDRVRDSHADIDGEIVRLGDPFSNGLLYPGDRNGPLEEIIQCRCNSIPYILPEGYAAPPLPYFRVSDLILVEGGR